MFKLFKLTAVAAAALAILTVAPTFTPAAEAVPGYRIDTTLLGGGNGMRRVLASTAAPGVPIANGTILASIICQAPMTKLGWSAYANNATWDLIYATDGYRWVHDIITSTPGNGGRQYLPDGSYFTPTIGIPRCTADQIAGRTTAPAPTLPRDRAADAALATVGHVYAQDTGDAGWYPASDWSPGPYGEWSGDCKKLVGAAYKRVGIDIGPGDAAATYVDFYNRGLVKPMTTTPPPKGALVFWPTVAGRYGHIAISTGDGYVVTTVGMDETPQTPGAGLKPNAKKPLNYLGVAPAGWALPPGA